MKKIIILLFTYCLISSAYSQNQRINFEEKNWHEVLKKAKQENKPIFVDVYATWCLPCRQMDNIVYTNDSVALYLNSNFVSTKIQVDSSKNDNENVKYRYKSAAEFVRIYDVKTFPTFLYFDSKGQLVHRDQGIKDPRQFIEAAKVAQDTTQNLYFFEKRYKNRILKGNDLLKYAIMISSFGNDTLSTKIATEYKQREIGYEYLEQKINKSNREIFTHFTKIFRANDPVVIYIYQHKNLIDSLVQQKGFSNDFIDQLAMRDILSPYLKRYQTDSNITPDWNYIERKIVDTWDQGTANRTLATSKIKWYYAHKEWDSLVKYQIIKIDEMEIPFGEWQAFAVNNFVWNIIFKKSNDAYALKRACDYMKSITQSYPEDIAAIDTYANILYKTGKKELAISLEKRALTLAETRRDHEATTLYRETLKKMEADRPTWQ